MRRSAKRAQSGPLSLGQANPYAEHGKKPLRNREHQAENTEAT
jgi:hypothetical protein